MIPFIWNTSQTTNPLWYVSLCLGWGMGRGEMRQRLTEEEQDIHKTVRGDGNVLCLHGVGVTRVSSLYTSRCKFHYMQITPQWSLFFLISSFFQSCAIFFQKKKQVPWREGGWHNYSALSEVTPQFWHLINGAGGGECQLSPVSSPLPETLRTPSVPLTGSNQT